MAHLALTGAEEALHVAGEHMALWSTATAMSPLFIAAGSYTRT